MCFAHGGPSCVALCRLRRHAALCLGRLRRPARSRSHVRLRSRLRLLQLGLRLEFGSPHRSVASTREGARRAGWFRRRNPLPAPHAASVMPRAELTARHSRCSFLRLWRLRRHARFARMFGFGRGSDCSTGVALHVVAARRVAPAMHLCARREGAFRRRSPLPAPHGSCHADLVLRWGRSDRRRGVRSVQCTWRAQLGCDRLLSLDLAVGCAASECRVWGDFSVRRGLAPLCSWGAAPRKLSLARGFDASVGCDPRCALGGVARSVAQTTSQNPPPLLRWQ